MRESVPGSLCPPPDDSVDSMQEEEDYDAVDEDDRYGFLPSSVVCTPEWGECKVTQLLLLCVECARSSLVRGSY